MTIEFLTAAAAIALSLALAYVPAWRAKYDALDGPAKARVMAALLIGVTLVIYGSACANILSLFGLSVACTAQSAADLAKLLFIALVSNVSTFVMFVDPYKTKKAEPISADSTVSS